MCSLDLGCRGCRISSGFGFLLHSEVAEFPLARRTVFSQVLGAMAKRDFVAQPRSLMRPLQVCAWMWWRTSFLLRALMLDASVLEPEVLFIISPRCTCTRRPTASAAAGSGIVAHNAALARMPRTRLKIASCQAVPVAVRHRAFLAQSPEAHRAMES